MLLLVWRLRFCPKLTQESPDRCGEAIATVDGRLRRNAITCPHSSLLFYLLDF
ncbi:hypothetical protein [Nostoc sp. WHI]|uniref:hypothetical protein n=1 Tax=Nostoc sp. WHI TaxID=2650611 RepID=UPI0018C74D52|nr:hypothetical protein [Nostoc sp. WHI]